MTTQKITLTLFLFWLVGCTSSVAEPIAIERPSLTPTTFPSPTQPLAIATMQPTQTAEPSPTPIPTQTPTPPPNQTAIPTPTTIPTLSEIPLGLVYHTADTNQSFVMTEAGFEPFEAETFVGTNGRYTLQTRLIENYDYSTAILAEYPDKQLILTDTESQTEQILLPNVVGAEVVSWWSAEPDWFVIQEAQTEASWSPWVGPLQVSVARLDGSEVHSLFTDIPTHTLSVPPAINPVGDNIVFATQQGGFWYYSLNNRELSAFDVTEYGVDFTWERYTWMEWSPNGRYIAVTTRSPYSLLVFDMQNKTHERLDIPDTDFNPSYLDEGWPAQFAWSPDSNKLLLKGFQSEPEEKFGLWVWDRVSDTYQYLVQATPYDLYWLDTQTVMIEGFFNQETILYNITDNTVTSIPLIFTTASDDSRYLLGVKRVSHTNSMNIPLLYDRQTGELYILDIEALVWSVWWQ